MSIILRGPLEAYVGHCSRCGAIVSFSMADLRNEDIKRINGWGSVDFFCPSCKTNTMTIVPKESGSGRKLLEALDERPAAGGPEPMAKDERPSDSAAQRLTFAGRVETLTLEVGGAVFISEPIYKEGTKSNLMVRLLSFDEAFLLQKHAGEPNHEEFLSLVGKKVRVTVEVLND